MFFVVLATVSEHSSGSCQHFLRNPLNDDPEKCWSLISENCGDVATTSSLKGYCPHLRQSLLGPAVVLLTFEEFTERAVSTAGRLAHAAPSRGGVSSCTPSELVEVECKAGALTFNCLLQ